MNSLNQLAFHFAEHGFLPDVAIRLGIRHLLKQRLIEIGSHNLGAFAAGQDSFIEEMKRSPVALVPEKANEQHYEVPVAFFEKVLGPHLKYSSAYWPDSVKTLADAELAGLRESCRHAEIKQGQHILELGCGWGSLTLWMAENYPDSHITAVSNSQTQREYIQHQLRNRKLSNVQVITCDMNTFDISPDQFDRVVSVEMFEHMRNWPELFARVHRWLRTGGKFFMHIFVHRTVPYAFEDKGPNDWMSRHFFTGGLMPSHDLPLALQDHIKFIRRWQWDGAHYEKTANAWLSNMDAQRKALWPIFVSTYGESRAQTWWMRWRIFFMACAELFGYAKGKQWWVGHYLFEKPVRFN